MVVLDGVLQQIMHQGICQPGVHPQGRHPADMSADRYLPHFGQRIKLLDFLV